MAKQIFMIAVLVSVLALAASVLTQSVRTGLRNGHHDDSASLADESGKERP